MCSGCSGDYAGGFEFDDNEEATADSEDRGSSASLRATPDNDLRSCRGRAPGGFEQREDSAENFEILVSGTQIIEIRVIPATSQAHDEFWKKRDPETHKTRKHSSGASAKYYQTRQISQGSRRYATHSLRFSRWVAGVCKSRFKGWIEETRRFVKGRTPQSV